MKLSRPLSKRTPKMDNKQLLERVAKAAGYDFEILHGKAWKDGWICFANEDPWDPLEDDADAFRLMVDCNINVEFWDHKVGAAILDYFPDENPVFYADHSNDKHAATRMAIVRAAAQSQEPTKWT
jgi:hypothetical protein